MTAIELTNIEDGVFVFEPGGKLRFCSEFCDTVLPELRTVLDGDTYMEDVYTAIISLGFKVLGSTNNNDLVAAGWPIFKTVPSNIEFSSADGCVLRWTSRHYGNDEVLAFLSDVSPSMGQHFRGAQRAKMSSISAVSAQIAHDLNNFLTIIQGNLELLEAFAEDNKKLGKWLAAASDAAERGSDMAKNLLYLGRRRPARRRDVATADVIKEIIAKLRSKISSSIEMVTLIPSDLNNIRVDENHFKLVLEHLLQNAIDAFEGESESRGGYISIHAEKIIVDEIRTELENHEKLHEFDTRNGSTKNNGDNGAYIRITVSDTGKGMSAELLERVLEPYMTTKKDQKGRGLGLSIAYGFAQQSGGDLVVESKPERGTTVVLEIPIGSDSPQISETATDLGSGIVGGSERIMVVEDDGAVRAIAVQMLTSIGYEVIQATDAANALRQLKQGCEVNLVFSDVIMPGAIDGIHLARIIRDSYRSCKILLASGYIDSDRLYGADEFTCLGKPYNQKILAQQIRQLFDGA